MTHLWVLLLLLNVSLKSEAQVFGLNLIKTTEDYPDQLVCTLSLLAKYFYSGESLSGFVLHMSITSASTHVQQSLLHALHTDSDYQWTILLKNTHRDADGEVNTQHVLHEKPQCYFFVIQSLEDEDMNELFESWKSNLNWNPLAQFVVYLSTVEETEEEMNDVMIEILLYFMNKKIYNVNIIGQSEESNLFFSRTVFPYHPNNNCGNRVISIETVDICDYQKSEEEEESDENNNQENEDNKEVEDGAEELEDFGMKYEVEEKKEEQMKRADSASFSSTNENNERKEGEGEDGYNKQEEGLVNKQDKNKTNNVARTFKKLNTQDSSQPTAPSDVEYVADSNKRLANYKALAFFTDNSLPSKYPKLYIEELHRALFLDKFPRDLSGCPLVAAFRPWEPYIFNEALDNSLYATSTESKTGNQTFFNSTYGEEEEIGDDDDNDNDNDDIVVYDKQQGMEAEAPSASSEILLNGIEYKMIQTIAERLHISIEMQVENTNLYHLFQQLIDGDIEMVVGGIDEDPSLSQFVSSTIPYHQDDLTWCVAKAQYTHNIFNFMNTFQIGAWILTLLFILSASLTIFMSQQCLNLRLALVKSYFSINIYVMGIVLSQAVHLRPMRTSLKLCFGAAFFMGLMFSNIYQSFLVSTLTTPKSSYQISHLNEIYQNRMHIMGSVDNIRHLNKEGEIYRYVREQFQMCYNIEECLQRAAKDTKLAVAVSRHHSFYNPRIPRDSLYCFDRNENINVYLVVMLMPKKYHLLHKINPVIQHIIESGHMQKWARDLDMRRKIIEEIQRARKEPIKSLTLSDIGGSFLLSGLLLLFASWIFAMEHAVHWLVVKRKTRLKLAKYMHRKLV